MARRAKYLHIWLHDIKEDDQVAIKEDHSWRRGWIEKYNQKTKMVKICLGDFGRIIWRPVNEIFHLENQFRELPWQAIACGLAYTRATKQIKIGRKEQRKCANSWPKIERDG